MLNLKIHFSQMAGGGLWVKSAFLCDFGTFLYVNLHNVFAVSPFSKAFKSDQNISGL